MATFGALTRLFCATDSDHETDHDPPSTMSLAPLAASGVAGAVLAANAWRNRHYPGFAYVAAMELAAAFWIFCDLGEQLDPRPVARAALFESMPEVVLVLNEHDVMVDANRAACALRGHTERALLGLPWPQAFPAPEWHTIPHGSHNVLEREWVRDGTTTCLEVQGHPLWDAAGRSLGLLIVVRVGGDQFLVLLPATGAEEAERIRARLTGALARFNTERSLALRFPTGVSVIAEASDWAAGMKRVDERLYDAKREASAGQL